MEMEGAVIAFAEARLAEDEALARAAADGRDGDYRWQEVDPVCQPGLIGTRNGDVVTFNRGTAAYAVSPSRGQAAHIARHDPARALREVEGKRAILRAYREGTEKMARQEAAGAVDNGVRGAVTALYYAVLQMAAAWNDHPGYCELVA
jgi:hypothetical protein